MLEKHSYSYIAMNYSLIIYEKIAARERTPTVRTCELNLLLCNIFTIA
jgi:hypothetical protein